MDPEKMHEAWKISKVVAVIIRYLFLSWEYPDEANLGLLRQVSRFLKEMVESQIGAIRSLPEFTSRNIARQFVAMYLKYGNPGEDPQIFYTWPSNYLRCQYETFQVGEQYTRFQPSSSTLTCSLTKKRFYDRATLAGNPLRVNINERLVNIIRLKDFTLQLFHGDILITFQKTLPKAVFFFSRHIIPQDLICTMRNDVIALVTALSTGGQKMTFNKDIYFESLIKNKEISEVELEVARLLLSFDKQIGSSILGSLLIKRKRSQEGLAGVAARAPKRR